MSAAVHLDNACLAVQVRALHEKSAAEHLALRGGECFLPPQLRLSDFSSASGCSSTKFKLFVKDPFRVVVSVTLLRRSIGVEVDRGDILPLGSLDVSEV